MQNMINFAAPPALGTKIYKGDDETVLTLQSVQPHIRANGQPGHILTWAGSDGREYTSGLRSKSVGSKVTFFRCDLPQNQIAR